MRLEECVALVTGANRSLGAVFARALLDRGATRVYAGARDPGSVSGPNVVPVRLDVTDADQVVASAQRCGDVTLLINNAGALTDSPLLAAPTLDGAHAEMAVNYFGTLAMCRTFAPILGRNDGRAIVNVLSVASFFANPAMGSYAASKSAAWALTNAVRIELRSQGTQVLAVHAGYIDTDMAAGVTAAKTSPGVVATTTLDALEAGAEELLVDERTRRIKAAVPADLTTIYPEVQRPRPEAPERRRTQHWRFSHSAQRRQPPRPGPRRRQASPTHHAPTSAVNAVEPTRTRTRHNAVRDRAVNAVSVVCAATPGIRTTADLPQFVATLA